MLHDYRSDDGVVITIKRSIKDPVKPTITRKGVEYHRVYSPCMIMIGTKGPKKKLLG